MLLLHWLRNKWVLLAITATLAVVSSPVQAFKILPAPDMIFGFCPPNQQQVTVPGVEAGFMCADKCASGYTGLMGVCWQNCPSGFTDVGAFCTNLDINAKDTYGRGAGKPLVCAPGLDQDGALCYPQCKSGFKGVGPVCWEASCPPGTDLDTGVACVRWGRMVWRKRWWGGYPAWVDGWVHWRSSYGRGAGRVLSACRAGQEKDGALCYPQCKSGYNGVGPVCWQKCPKGYTDDGAFCRRDNGFAKKSYVAQWRGVVSVCPDGYPKDTHYPIVLVHGFLGFDKLLGFAPYFNGIPECLRRGGATVFTPAVSATNSTEVRSEQLLEEVREIIRKTGKGKVHLIGHSHGGPTARYVAGTAPELVASVTTVGGVNYGSKVADASFLIAEPFGRPGEVVVEMPSNAFNSFITLISGKSVHELPQDFKAAGLSLTTAGSLKFNKKFPAGLMGPGKSTDTPLGHVEKEVQYSGQSIKKKYPMLFYSWTGQMPFASIGMGMVPLPHSYNMMGTIGTTYISIPHGLNSDGLVDVDSTYFGQFLGAYHMDHLMETNMWVGVELPIFSWRAHPITLFAEHAYRLKKAEDELLLPRLRQMGDPTVPTN